MKVLKVQYLATLSFETKMLNPLGEKAKMKKKTINNIKERPTFRYLKL